MLLSLLVLLTPLTLYLLFLAGIHRRARPTILSGVAESVGLLFAASGLFLFVIPGILRYHYAGDIRAVAVHQRTDTDFEMVRSKYRILWAGYYAVLVVGAGGFLWFRRRATVILNVDYESFRLALERILEEMKIDARLLEGKLSLVERTAPHHEQDLVLDAFPALSHLTLVWRGRDAYLRREIEGKLRKYLIEDAISESGLPGMWLLVTGSLLFGMVIFVATLLVLRWWLTNRLM